MRYFESLARVEDYFTDKRDEHRKSKDHYAALASAPQREQYEPNKSECRRLVEVHFAKMQAYDDALQALKEIRPDIAAALREAVTGVKPS